MGAGRIFLSCLVTCYVAYFVFFFFLKDTGHVNLNGFFMCVHILTWIQAKAPE